LFPRREQTHLCTINTRHPVNEGILESLSGKKNDEGVLALFLDVNAPLIEGSSSSTG